MGLKLYWAKDTCTCSIGLRKLNVESTRKREIYVKRERGNLYGRFFSFLPIIDYSAE